MRQADGRLHAGMAAHCNARAALMAALVLAGPLAGCNFESGSSVGSANAVVGGIPAAGSGSASPGYVTGSPGIKGFADAVIATPSQSGTVSVAAGANATVSVTFTSGDGRPIRGLAISNTTLPLGWSGIDGYDCTLVGAASSCVVNLTYAPTQPGSGSLALNYIFIDNANEPKTPGGTLTIPYAAIAANNVIATAAPEGQVSASSGGGSRSVIVNFVTDDGNAATDLSLVTDLSGLPPGWSSATPSLACPIVSTGSGCQLLLTFSPSAPGSGILSLAFVYTDDSGTSRSGSLNIPYTSATSGNVMATVSPNGQVSAVQKAGSQAVTFSFATDDGTTATDLAVQSDLTRLPPGWHANAASFACASVRSSGGCRLTLDYAPTALARGTLTLTYSYFDGSGTYSIGTTEVTYAATTNDNVIGTPAPSGEVQAIVGQNPQTVDIPFTTDDGRPATALRITTDLTALPTGWSASSDPFVCSGLATGTGCQLSLSYAPVAAASGVLALAYTYLNDAGQAKSGSLDLPFRATTDDNVVASASPASVSVASGSSIPVTIVFNTDDGNPAIGLTLTSGLESLPPGWSSSVAAFGCPLVQASGNCQLSLTYSPAAPATGTLTLGFAYTNDAGISKTGAVTVPYAAQ